MSKLNVAIADDNERILRLLGEIVSKDEELQVVGTAKDGEEAYKMIKEKARNLNLTMTDFIVMCCQEKVVKNTDKN
mgnify:CR=1 FL=1